ncbi:MAG: Imidazoleglycerol-phosphate dehydratase [Candidatus Carbobacillus altaicus]|uniref:Imidazoleglycerol-phosphate dehydratase n=1 Tax=Candidatus Carbonibacillus altaicus TaxID=2163959 RepID=A0A2R6XYM7_9BACL|nr:MAG: Imidazoleglycerol-phosphate dehydratase [Candidatus Carbobacillus altaicus]
MHTIRVFRHTRESHIEVVIDDGPIDWEMKEHLTTPLPFFNHMLEHIAWRSGLNVKATAKLDGFFLAHVITEDTGTALGRAIDTYLEENASRGMFGYGFAYGTIDEALARVVLSFEKRALFSFNPGSVVLPEETEGLKSEDLIAFFEGFAQGGRATVHLDLIKGRPSHGHHIWEAAFRAFGQALYEVLRRDARREGMTPGVAGSIHFSVDVKTTSDGNTRQIEDKGV